LLYERMKMGQGKRGARIPGLLPDVTYTVSGYPSVQKAARTQATAWRFGEDTKKPTLTLKMVKPQVAKTIEAPTAETLKKDVESLPDVLWQKKDRVQGSLTWYALKAGLAVADGANHVLLHYPELLGHPQIVASGIAFGPRRAWAGTNRGLVAWDRERRYWSLFAVGGIHLDSPVEKLSVEAGRLFVTVRPPGEAAEKFTYDLQKSRWIERQAGLP